MGIYVQENRYQIQLIFSGPWAENKTDYLDVIENQSSILIFMPSVIFAAANLALITSTTPLPGNLIPAQDYRVQTFGKNGGTSTQLTALIHSSDGTIQIGLGPDANTTFSNTGDAGFYPTTLIYAKKVIRPPFSG